VRSAERLAGLAATCGALAAGEVPADHARLIARASSEGPIDEAELVEAARTQDLWLGRRRRCASDAQRIALMVRDKACVGCGAEANRSFAHHIHHWKNGGGTDYPNLVTVCNDCPRDIHEKHHQIEHDQQTGQHRVMQPPEAFPDTGTTTWQPEHLNPILRN